MKPRQKRPRHGLNSLKARVSLRGLAAIDRRSAAGRALVQWRSQLVRDLGGADAISAQRSALVDVAVRTRLLLEHVDAWLVTQPSLVVARRRTVLPVLVQRQQLADSLARVLAQLGLERVQPPRRPLAEVFRERAAERVQTQHAPAGGDEANATAVPSSDVAHVAPAGEDEAAPAVSVEAVTVPQGAEPATHREHVPRDEPAPETTETAPDHPETSFPRVRLSASASRLARERGGGAV